MNASMFSVINSLWDFIKNNFTEAFSIMTYYLTTCNLTNVVSSYTPGIYYHCVPKPFKPVSLH